YASDSVFFFQAEDGIRDYKVTGVQTCALPISSGPCAKRPGWTAENLKDAPLGRSHRAKIGKAKLKQAIELTRDVLEVPADYKIRSEERRVGKECRARGSAEAEKRETHNQGGR